MAECACDECDGSVETGQHCGFCTSNCYPTGILGTRKVQLVMSPASRAEVHARARGEIPIESFDPKKIAQQAGKKIVDSAIEAAKPMAKEALKEGFKYLQRRLGVR